LEQVESLWADKGVQEAYQRRHEFQLDSNASYYFDNAKRFVGEDYVPTLDDIFKVRQKTSGITEHVFTTDSLEMTLVDVGGQRSERRKWLHCFQDVTAVLYFISLDEYNLQLSEDYRVNRLQEALDLFEEITTSEFFTKSHFFVLFNKNDLFKEKVDKQPLSELFTEFSGKDNYSNSLKFIQSQFKARFGGDEQHYRQFVICSLDTQCIRDTVDELKKLLNEKAAEL